MKIFTLCADTIFGGSSFHSEMVLGKNEFLYTIVFDVGRWKQLLWMFWCLVTMFCATQFVNFFARICLLFCSGIKYSFLSIAGTVPFCMLYRKHSLFSFLLALRSGRCNSFGCLSLIRVFLICSCYL